MIIFTRERYGQLGRGKKCDIYPAKIPFFEKTAKVTLVCAGKEHCFVATGKLNHSKYQSLY